jgi:hypothetical protein
MLEGDDGDDDGGDASVLSQLLSASASTVPSAAVDARVADLERQLAFVRAALARAQLSEAQIEAPPLAGPGLVPNDGWRHCEAALAASDAFALRPVRSKKKAEKNYPTTKLMLSQFAVGGGTSHSGERHNKVAVDELLASHVARCFPDLG